jgi:hypothetical protein
LLASFVNLMEPATPDEKDPPAETNFNVPNPFKIVGQEVSGLKSREELLVNA